MIKNQTARVVLMWGVAIYRLNQQPNLDGVQKAAAPISVPRLSRATRTTRATRVMHRCRGKRERAHRWANASRDKFVNNRPQRLRTNTANRVGKPWRKKRQIL